MRYRFDQVLYQKDKSLLVRAVLFPLYLVSLLYGWAVRLRTHVYRVGLCPVRRLPCPVISVGNITMGGTGKTPLVMALAKGLRKHRIPVAVLTRGYRSRGSSGFLVSDGENVLLSPEESGDEPTLMAKTLKGVPVLIGKDRFRNGQRALQQFGVQGFLLDDGFQHIELYRDLDILLIDASLGFGDHHLLPRGILREPLDHLGRAHLFILTKVESPEACQPIEARLRQVHPNPIIFHSHYEPVGLMGPQGEWSDVQTLKGKKVLALSAIANPHSFTSLLRRSGAEVVSEEVYPDHHGYTSEDVVSITQRAKETEWIVTTEKDMVKLSHFDLTRIPIRALRVEFRIWEEEEFFRKVMELFPNKEDRH
jgi:tetraacyldisaccharide 4'-kinase